MKTLLSIMLCLITACSLAQPKDTVDVEKDLLDIIRGKNHARKSAGHRKLMRIYMPLVTTSPATGTSFGLTGTGLWYNGDPKTTDLSNLAIVGLVSTKQQVQLILRSSIYTKENKWMLMNDWRYFKFSQPTFGLGSSAPGYTLPEDGFHILGINTSSLESGQMMLFNYVKLSQYALYKAFGPLYIGLGYSFDSHYDIEDQRLNLTGDSVFVTSHYAYSVANGFNPTSYRSSGVSINFSIDTRDNGINSYTGHYAWLSYQINSKGLGSSQDGGILWAEYRTYLSLSKKHKRNVLALWTFANAAIGKVPYLDLPSMGWDMNGSSARGYAQGRYRGESYMYAEAEWRFPISRHNGLWGGVLFANISTLSNKDEDEQVFENFNPAGGAGLRFKAVKRARLNFYLDYAVGQNGSHGLYFGLGEFF
ncbi:MAG: BamA/TamA family outer membrane protein [Chryseolinea sp.]